MQQQQQQLEAINDKLAQAQQTLALNPSKQLAGTTTTTTAIIRLFLSLSLCPIALTPPAFTVLFMSFQAILQDHRRSDLSVCLVVVEIVEQVRVLTQKRDGMKAEIDNDRKGSIPEQKERLMQQV